MEITHLPDPVQSYYEIGQVNPIRWRLMFLDDNGFVSQAGWMKCKDFFNDVVAHWKTGVVFTAYHFENKVKFQKDGLYILVKFIKDREQFKHNLSIITSKIGHNLGGPGITAQDSDEEDEVMLHFPKEILESTYRMSLATLLIRFSNYGAKFKNWEDLLSHAAIAQQEKGAFPDNVRKEVKVWGFKVPDEYEQYWWYCGYNYNSVKTPDQGKGTIVHNCGMVAWWQYIWQDRSRRDAADIKPVILTGAQQPAQGGILSAW